MGEVWKVNSKYNPSDPYPEPSECAGRLKTCKLVIYLGNGTVISFRSGTSPGLSPAWDGGFELPQGWALPSRCNLPTIDAESLLMSRRAYQLQLWDSGFDSTQEHVDRIPALYQRYLQHLDLLSVRWQSITSIVSIISSATLAYSNKRFPPYSSFGLAALHFLDQSEEVGRKKKMHLG
jgi:hypothetical protein